MLNNHNCLLDDGKLMTLHMLVMIIKVFIIKRFPTNAWLKQETPVLMLCGGSHSLGPCCRLSRMCGNPFIGTLLQAILHVTRVQFLHSCCNTVFLQKLLHTYLVGESTHEDTVAGQLTHVTRAQFPHLCCNTVFLHQRFLQCWHATPLTKAFVKCIESETTSEEESVFCTTSSSRSLNSSVSTVTGWWRLNSWQMQGIYFCHHAPTASEDYPTLLK
jgi:hypothetical protein